MECERNWNETSIFSLPGILLQRQGWFLVPNLLHDAQQTWNGQLVEGSLALVLPKTLEKVQYLRKCGLKVTLLPALWPRIWPPTYFLP